MEEEEQEEAATKLDGLRSSLKEQRRQEHDDQMFPDEVGTVIATLGRHSACDRLHVA